jgi:hypothetical protein
MGPRDEAVLEKREGYRVHLFIDGRTRPFVLQLEGNRPRILADFASGYHLADLGPLMLRCFVARPSAYREMPRDWRAQAQLWLDDVCARKGARDVLAKLNSVPVVNG